MNKIIEKVLIAAGTAVLYKVVEILEEEKKEPNVKSRIVY